MSMITIGAGAVVLVACNGLPVGSKPGFQKDGSYILAPVEQAYGCEELIPLLERGNHHLRLLLNEMNEQKGRTPETAAAMVGRMFGNYGFGLSSKPHYDSESIRLASLLATAHSKACATAEVEVKLNQTHSDMLKLLGQP